MTNIENYKYFKNFKKAVVRGFYAINDLEFLKKYLKKIKEKKFLLLLFLLESLERMLYRYARNILSLKKLLYFVLIINKMSITLKNSSLCKKSIN